MLCTNLQKIEVKIEAKWEMFKNHHRVVVFKLTLVSALNSSKIIIRSNSTLPHSALPLDTKNKRAQPSAGGRGDNTFNSQLHSDLKCLYKNDDFKILIAIRITLVDQNPLRIIKLLRKFACFCQNFLYPGSWCIPKTFCTFLDFLNFLKFP